MPVRRPHPPLCRLLRLGFGLVILAGASGPAAGAEEERIRFSTNFEGGSLGTIEALGESEFRCHVKGQQNEHGRNRQASWYFFRIDGARGRDLTLILTDFVGEYNERPGACPMGPDIIPVYSNDGSTWDHLPRSSWDERTKELTLRIRPERDAIWIAHQQPYTPRQLARLLEDVDRSEDARVEIIGRSALGRELHLVTVTSDEVPDKDKATVWLQARQHAWESGTSFVMEGALRFATSEDSAARELRRKVVFKFTPMVDPDGAAPRGRSASTPTASTSTATGTKSTCARSGSSSSCPRSGTRRRRSAPPSMPARSPS
jgi:hypothetical protein